MAELPWALVLATNYDALLARALGERYPVVSEVDHNRLDDAVPPRLIQLHGSLTDVHTLTRDDYRQWVDRRPRAAHALRDALLRKTVLFVGYGNKDPHLNDALLPQVRQWTQGHEKRLHAWEWEVSDQRARLPARSCHDSILSRFGVSNFPGAVQLPDRSQSCWGPTRLARGRSPKSPIGADLSLYAPSNPLDPIDELHARLREDCAVHVHHADILYR